METRYDITDDVKREVLDATDLVALIGATTSLKKAGSSWKGLCPFHGEKTPSFHVSPEKGVYYCFGCQAKGDAISFVRETERLEFPEAVAYLARLAGVDLPVKRSGTRADRAKETRASEALLSAARFFLAGLERHAGARALLARRGITPADAVAYGFGAAPDSWDALKASLSGTFPEEALLEAGLLQRNPETGRVYDRFRNRLTIEIKDARGELLGFGARALGDDQPKYLNSPETSRFSKGRILYGLDRAKEPIRRANTAILVEGYFDRIALAKAGCENAVASMGTALTAAQADLLARHAGTVVVAYDGDPPGRAAAFKAFSLLLERGTNVKHLALPHEHDPDSFLAARGADALRAEVEGAAPLLTTLLGTIPPAGADPSERAARVSEAVAILTSAPDRVLRHELLAGFSRGTGIPLRVLTGVEGKKRQPEPVHGLEKAGADRLPESEERVLSVLLSEWPESGPLIRGIPGDVFMHPIAKEIFAALKELNPASPTLDFSALASHVGGGAELVVARLLFQEPREIEGRSAGDGGAKGLERLHKPLLQLKIRQLEERGITLQRQIERARAGASGETPETESSLREKQALSAEIRRLKQELRSPRHPGHGE